MLSGESLEGNRLAGPGTVDQIALVVLGRVQCTGDSPVAAERFTGEGIFLGLEQNPPVVLANALTPNPSPKGRGEILSEFPKGEGRVCRFAAKGTVPFLLTQKSGQSLDGRLDSDNVIGDKDFYVARGEEDLGSGANSQAAEPFLR